MTDAPFDTVDDLENRLSEPTEPVSEVLRKLEGDILVLGVGGKMGPTLARMARRAFDAAGLRRRVIGVSRFSDGSLMESLRAAGVDPIRCDLLDEEAVARLPEAENVIFMAGMKFGSTGREALTWAMNAHLPAVVCRRFRCSRIVAFSTGNVYGMSPVADGGSRESDLPHPVGEYAMSCLGRERMFEYFSHLHEIPTALIRLNYACEPRYGVLADLARRVWRGDVIDLTMGYFNVIWQGDANAMALQALGHTSVPPLVVNVTGTELMGVRDVCGRLGRLMGRPPVYSGEEHVDALLSNAQRATGLFGPPRVGAGLLIEWVARWVMGGGADLGKPTHFESRDGNF